MGNYFIIDYEMMCLILKYKNQIYEFDLKDGDLNDYWNSFTDNQGICRDINFYLLDREPYVSVYEIAENAIQTDRYENIPLLCTNGSLKFFNF